MKTRDFASLLFSLFIAGFLWHSVGQSNLRGAWIRPEWPDGNEPQFPNRAFCWTSASAMPNRVVVYRKEITVPAGREGVAALHIASPGHLYVFLDGKEVYGSDRRKENHVLHPFLSPGRHVLMVAAPAEGFAMAGFLHSDRQSLGKESPFLPIFSDATWRVNKFPPTTAIELELCCKAGFDDSRWFPVEADADRSRGASLEILVSVLWRGELERLSSDVDEAEWRLTLIARKGIAIVDSIAYYGWEADRVHPAAVSAAREGLASIPRARQAIAELLTKDVRNGASFDSGRAALFEVKGAVSRIRDLLESATNILYLADQAKNLANCSVLLKKGGNDFSPELGAFLQAFRSAEEALVRRDYRSASANALHAVALANALQNKMEQAWGHPLNRYNESRFSTMGWIPNADLVDGELADWGLHVGVAEAPLVVPVPRRWQFNLDPNNEGLARGWHTIGFNVEGQWPTLNVPGTWENRYGETNPNAPAQNPYKGKADVSSEGPYNGFAWYRTRVRIPDEWRGNDLELLLSWADDWDWTYFNERLVGKTGPETPNRTKAPRRYSLPRDIVKFGEENVIAIRVFDAGGEGGLGSVELRCPGLIAGGTSQPVSVIRSFLSPGILLHARGNELTVWGKKEADGQLFLPLRRGIALKKLRPGQSAYRLDRDQKLVENWLLWSPGFAGGAADRPVEIVLEKNPIEINAAQEGDRGSLTFVFAEAGGHAVFIRPLPAPRSEASQNLSEESFATCRFWARALLEYPLDYTEITRLDPGDTGFVQVFDMYDYRSLRSDWDVKPLRLAPAPVFLTYALRTGWPGLTVGNKLTDTGFDLGKYGTYQAVLGSDTVSYRYPRDKMLRLGGFTSWVFMPWDAGVPGNDRECEVISQTGANTYRPQHNFAGEKPRLFADYCNRYGINYMNNPDNVLGGKGGKHGENADAWVSHYRELARTFRDRPEYAVAFDLINEAANMKPEIYNPLIKRLTGEIRKIDPIHLLYVETCNSWGAVEQFPALAVTGDPRTIYSFHDYNFRLRGDDRWPSLRWDIQQMYKRWMPAFDFQLKNHVRLHLGEFGGYEKGGEFNPCAVTMLHDVFRILDQFNWHFHYYPGRGIMWPRADGSLRPNTVARAFQRYFDLGYFNMYFTPEERKVIQ